MGDHRLLSPIPNHPPCMALFKKGVPQKTSGFPIGWSVTTIYGQTHIVLTMTHNEGP